MNARAILAGIVLLLSPLPATAAAPNVVSDWAAIVQQAIHNPPAAPRSAGTSEILHAMVMLAVYDAAVAIEGGFSPMPPKSAGCRTPMSGRRSPRRRIAPLVPASRVAGGLPRSAVRLVSSGITEGLGKAEGIRVGEAAAQAVLTVRAVTASMPSSPTSAAARRSCLGSSSRTPAARPHRPRRSRSTSRSAESARSPSPARRAIP